MLQLAPCNIRINDLSDFRLITLWFALLFAHLIYSSNQPIPTTVIPDSTFEAALVALNIDSNGINGNILDSDAQAVTTLFIGNIGVSDLTGIEAFENLVNLYAYNNNLSSIDLSSNIHLEIIDLDNNNLSTIDLTSHSELKELLISNNNLTEINVSQNLLLEYLSCNLNSISALDLSSNTNLRDIRCYSNAISSIDLNTNIALEQLFISENNLTSLDLSMNTGLKTLTFDNNQIGSIDLSNNINLEYLGCSNNVLSALDVAANTKLTRLLSNNNNLTAIDLNTAEDLFLLYLQNNMLETLDLSNNSELRYFRAENNELEQVDIRNGDNARINEFVVSNNPDLTCIFVDDTNASYLSDWEMDDTCSFVEDQDECQSLLSIDEQTVLEFSFYPNPADTVVYIESQVPEAHLVLYTISGQLIKTAPLTHGRNAVDISHLSSGIYAMVIKTETSSFVNKLMIR